MITEAVVENKIQYDVIIKRKDVDTIIVSRDCFVENDIKNMISDIKSSGKKVCIRLERISRFDEEYTKDNRLIKDNDIYDYKKIMSIKELDGLLIQNIDSFARVMDGIKKGKGVYDHIDIELDYTMNVYNNESKKFFDKYYDKLLYTYPIELSIKDMKELNMDTLVVYSHLPIMVSANCVHKTNGKCQMNKTGFLKDRLNEKVYYKSYCKYCYSKMFNPSVYYIKDLLDENNKDHNLLDNISFSKIRYEFSICENIKDIEKVFDNIEVEKKFDKWTRGHIKKSIE